MHDALTIGFKEKKKEERTTQVQYAIAPDFAAQEF
jgi:hypothetical protein